MLSGSLKHKKKLKMETSNPLIGKTVLKIEVNEEKDVIRFYCEDVVVLGHCEADCCSNTWIEHVEYPALGYPAKVLNVEDLDLPGSSDDGELKVYGIKISTDKGDLIIDFRNESNGYYGGGLKWSVQTPKEPIMSTTEQESINHIRQTSETLNTSKEITGEDIRKIANATNAQPLLFDSKGNETPYYQSLSRAARVAIWRNRFHPKHILASRKSNELKAKRADQKARLKQVSELGGYRFLVFGRLTVCYRRSKSVLYIATTLRNAKDIDDPVNAKLGAAYRMAQDQYIVVPIHPKNNAKYEVKSMFFFAAKV